MSDNYFDGQANQYGNEANHIASNGGTGSVDYWTAKANQANAQAIADGMRNENYGLGNPATSTNPFGQTTTTPGYYSGSGGGAGLNVKQLGVFVLSCAAAWWAYSLTTTAFSPDPPFERYPIFYPSYNTPKTPGSHIKMSRDMAVSTARERYGALFQADTPYQKLFDGCSPVYKCTEHSYKGFKNLMPYARNPLTYWEEVCRISQGNLYGNRNLPVAPKWHLREVQKKDGLSTSHVCELSNARELYAAAQGRQTIVTGVAGSLAAGLVGMGFLLSRRLRTVRQ